MPEGSSTGAANSGNNRRRHRRNRKGGGASSDAGGEAQKTVNNTSTSGGRGSSKPNRRRGTGGGGRGGRGSSSYSESSRYKATASSPLQLPHVKITIRNIILDNGNSNSNKHSSINEMIQSVKSFLDGTFPSSKVAGDGTVETDAYMLAWQAEREEFDNAKLMFSEETSNSVPAATSNSENATASGTATSSPSSTATRAFSSGWLYEEKPLTLPSNRESLLPTTDSIVTNLMSNQTEKKIQDTSKIDWVVDSAMAQMMQESGKQYLHYVGGRIILEEESAIDAGLAERVANEREKLAKAAKKIAEESATNTDENGESGEQSNVDAKNEDKEVATTEVEEVTQGMDKLSTSDNKAPSVKQDLNNVPAIRIRILSVTPIKRSKRRGDIGGKVTLAMYPPDPCLLFKEVCRDAGKMAGDIQFEKMKAKADEDGKKEVEAAEDEKEKAKDDVVEESKSGDEATNDKEGEEAKDDTKTPLPPVVAKKVSQPPQIPYYPLLSPAERSRAVARSRVLMHRTIEAMKIHAAQSSDIPWEVMESESQKTWKSRPHAMVASLMEGKDLSELVAEHDGKEKGDPGAKKGRGGGRGGFDSRADRYDSTIQNSEDYKAFMDSMKDGGVAPSDKDADNKGAKNGDAKSAVSNEKTIEVDEEGRPLSAIVIHMRAKQAEVDKVKAKARAAVDKARAAAKSEKEQKRKERRKKKKEEKRMKSKEEKRTKKKKEKKIGSTNASRPNPINLAGPPPGATLLKKDIPTSGFGA